MHSTVVMLNPVLSLVILRERNSTEESKTSRFYFWAAVPPTRHAELDSASLWTPDRAPLVRGDGVVGRHSEGEELDRRIQDYPLLFLGPKSQKSCCSWTLRCAQSDAPLSRRIFDGGGATQKNTPRQQRTGGVFEAMSFIFPKRQRREVACLPSIPGKPHPPRIRTLNLF